MNKDNYIFSQLIRFMDRNKFNRLVEKYDGDRNVKHFTCWNQLLVLMFGQLSYRSSLRDLIAALEAHHSKLYHLGMGRNVSRNNLAYANQERNYRIFEEFAFYMMKQAQDKRKTDIFKLNGNVYAFDSTTIDLCLALFPWAKFRKKKGGIKAHVLYDVEAQVPAFFLITTASVHDSKVMDAIPYKSGSYYVFDRGYNSFKDLFAIDTVKAYFVVRAKKNIQFKPLKWKRRLPKNVLSDAEGILLVHKSSKDYPIKIRKVVYWDEENKRKFIFLTNNFEISALDIALLYKNRWQVELFFKWLKQHLKIKKFWGTTENAVRIQVCAAIISYCLIAIIHHDTKVDRTIYEVLQILSISLTDRAPLRELLDKPNFQNFKDQSVNDGQLYINFE